MNNIELMAKSLRGLWVGDCVGNIGEFFYAQDILKALDEGIKNLGIDNIDPKGMAFQYSDDTEEAIVLVNHLFDNKEILQDKLAMEFAKRYMERDPDGEIYNYGLMTRTVLKNIYEGTPWREANQTKPRIEGTSFVDNLISNVSTGKIKNISEAMALTNADLENQLKKKPELKVGSCGNGSAMRVAPLGAYLYDADIEKIIEQAKLQSEVTHCHPEGIAGSIAVSLLSHKIASEFAVDWSTNNLLDTDYLDVSKDELYTFVIDNVPDSKVKDGIITASKLPLDTALNKLIEILGNGTHVTCQDTIPICIFLTIKALTVYTIKDMFEHVMIETCRCMGDIDTNCAIVGGMVGIVSSPPEKWLRYCQPLEGVMGEPLPEVKKETKEFSINMSALSEAMRNTEIKPDDKIVSLIKEGTNPNGSGYFKF